MPVLTSLARLPDQGIIQGLAPYQGWWNGLVFGEGTPWILDGNIDGLLSYESRLGDRPLPQGDGDISFSRWAAGKTIVWPFRILGDGALDARIQDWEVAFEATDSEAIEWLAFRTPGRLMLARARVTRRRVEMSPVAARTQVAAAVLEMKLADPRLYDGLAWEQTAMIPLEAGATGGFDLPTDLPITMAPFEPGAAFVTNHGALAYPLLRVSNQVGAGSAITQAVVQNVTTGVSVTLDVEIVAGQTLVADFGAIVRAERGPSIHIDNATRYGGWAHPRVPFYLARGDNIVTAEHTGGTPTFRLDWMPALL